MCSRDNSNNLQLPTTAVMRMMGETGGKRAWEGLGNALSNMGGSGFTKSSLPDRAPLFKCCRRGGARKPSAKIKLHLFRHPVETFTKQKNKTYNESFKKIHAWTKRSEATRAINDESSGSCQRISSRSKR